MGSVCTGGRGSLLPGLCLSLRDSPGGLGCGLRERWQCSPPAFLASFPSPGPRVGQPWLGTHGPQVPGQGHCPQPPPCSTWVPCGPFLSRLLPCSVLLPRARFPERKWKKKLMASPRNFRQPCRPFCSLRWPPRPGQRSLCTLPSLGLTWSQGTLSCRRPHSATPPALSVLCLPLPN